jgi:hypothetical protein
LRTTETSPQRDEASIALVATSSNAAFKGTLLARTIRMSLSARRTRILRDRACWPSYDTDEDFLWTPEYGRRVDKYYNAPSDW